MSIHFAICCCDDVSRCDDCMTDCSNCDGTVVITVSTWEEDSGGETDCQTGCSSFTITSLLASCVWGPDSEDFSSCTNSTIWSAEAIGDCDGSGRTVSIVCSNTGPYWWLAVGVCCATGGCDPEQCTSNATWRQEVVADNGVGDCDTFSCPNATPWSLQSTHNLDSTPTVSLAFS